ncbi:aminoacyl-histidine dipeptidase [Sporohalobacter salinus]|uniref:aminoacyl-histidine dipeptidase n=1 Tax=Sporohalobacter salinus TaxID=1494606 RepID=UPI001961C091|nr:aminoacyl-histidine dipeptidase [Sporohalobacter salinus]MBM7623629.1 dipeptidase D [Sporohalobacter salinus]
MERVLKDLAPEKVFKYFEEISRIPRGSGNEKEISDYLVDFAKQHDLEVIQDEALNVIIKKPASNGYENSAGVILQGHMDMVCEKNRDVDHNFSEDSIKLQVKDDSIMAKGTTLGADNGIAIAYSLAVLSSNDINHPPLEVLITTEEETGMGGANNLSASDLEGDILINLDSEEEGVLLAGCSGGIRNKVSLPIEWKEASENNVPYLLKVRGLKGGHSGGDIDKGRGNANKIIARILDDLDSEINFNIANINGGAKANAIPREADAEIMIKAEDEKKIKDSLERWDQVLKNEFASSDPDIFVEVEELDKNIDKVFSDKTSKDIVTLLRLIPYGINTMSMDIDGLVESSNNPGVVYTDEDNIHVNSTVRSSVNSLKKDIIKRIELIAELVQAEVKNEGDYPEWEFAKESYIREVCVDTYKEMYGEKPEISAVHMGLECGLFKEIFDDLDMISLGPNMSGVHTPDEKLSISSTRRIWNYLCSILENIK